MKKEILSIFLLLIFNVLVAQKGNNVLKDYEISFIELIQKDSGDFYTTIDNNEFQFGSDFRGATFLNFVKQKGQIFIQPLGTGRLYQIIEDNKKYRTIRIDSTIHSGVNFFSKTFFARDTLYQFGGLGFWSIRGIMTFFSKQTDQWELIQTNRAVPSFFDNFQEAVINIKDDAKAPKLYVSNSYKYKNYPQSFDIVGSDTCFVLDYNTKNWTALGKINPELKRVLLAKNSLALDFGNYLLVQSALEFYWINFENNAFGKLKPKFNNELRQKWLKIYSNETKIGITNFQFNVGKNIYFLKLSKDKQIEYEVFTYNEDMIDLSNQEFVYSNKTDYLGIVTNFLDTNKTFLLFILSIAALLFFIYSFQKKRKKLPKEVVSILNNNFYSSLTIVEKELIEELYNHHLKGEEVSTRLINKIIGVQQKDTLTQNKSRSDYFIRINQKFKMSTQYKDPLIVKQRDHSDKRQYNYSLNNTYIVDIEKLFKE
ncbi:MAG: hypothetical protein LW604_02260 [Sediminibacterium sp.]|jgi:hypothetical protein|nr:hypothetical protein [Sediminibacterium sp.]